MENNHCSFEIQKGEEGLVVVLKGEIDHHGAVRVRCELDELIVREHPHSVVFDLSGIEFMDSSGLGLMMGRYALLQKMGGTLRLKNPNERISKIFELANLGRIITIDREEKDEKEAKEEKEKQA